MVFRPISATPLGGFLDGSSSSGAAGRIVSLRRANVTGGMVVHVDVPARDMYATL